MRGARARGFCGPPQDRVHGPYTRSEGIRIGAAPAGGLWRATIADDWLALLNQLTCVALKSVLKWAPEHRAHPSLRLPLHRPNDLLFWARKSGARRAPHFPSRIFPEKFEAGAVGGVTIGRE